MSKMGYHYCGKIDDENSLYQWLVEVRRWIHRHAELSFEEIQTSAFIQERLQELGVTEVEVVAGTGVIATLPGKDRTVPKVALRADMDALPIVEETGLPFASETSGIMHACGHDGHVTMLLGAIAVLKEQKLAGDVVCIFQPAEEKANGAKKLVELGVLKGVDVVFGGHIDTHFEPGVITADEGIICAYADQFHIKVKGRGGHAAKPHETVDALVAGTSLVSSIQTLITRRLDPNHSAVITIGSFHAGEAANVIAEEAILQGTIRSTHTESREKVMTGLERMVSGLQEMYNVETTLTFEVGLPAVINDKEATKIAREAINRTEGAVAGSQGNPSFGGEDFSFYQEKVPGCMVRYGAAIDGGGVAHSSSYDFDEKALLFGAKWLANVAVRWHELQQE